MAGGKYKKLLWLRDTQDVRMAVGKGKVRK